MSDTSRGVHFPHGEQQQSLILLMQTSSLETLGGYLATGRRSVNGWLESLDCSVVVFTDNLDRFRNVNSEEELYLVLADSAHVDAAVGNLGVDHLLGLKLISYQQPK